jgi:two-component system osmolarity sensor histidine kinase EnvZ
MKTGRSRLLPLPMFWRIFAALILFLLGAAILFGATFGEHLNRVTADTLAPVWAAAIRTEEKAATAWAQGKRSVQVPIDLLVGPPPPHAYSIAADRRTVALVDALAKRGVSVTDTLLDDRTELPVTWLRVHPEDGPERWVGFAGGVQPSLFRTRTSHVLLALIVLIAIAAWFTSRWVARPMARLSLQVDRIARGEVPTEAVRGAREIERLGSELRRMAQQRAAFDEQRRVMLLGVSHDLRSPLTRIRVAADLLQAEPALRDLIVRNVEHADAIIESFLSYVRTDAEPAADEVDLGAVALTAARLAELPSDQTAVTPGVTVRGSPTMLQRMLMNLLDNAARHGAPPVSLSVTVDRSGNEAVVEVQDHGPGVVDPKRMLQPFERGDVSRAHGGAGLGLAIVARIVERHRGTLDIGTVNGGGTRVVVRLPLAGRTP